MGRRMFGGRVGSQSVISNREWGSKRGFRSCMHTNGTCYTFFRRPQCFASLSSPFWLCRLLLPLPRPTRSLWIVKARTCADPTPNDTVTNPTIINLSSLSFSVHTGDTILLQRLGGWSPNTGFPDNQITQLIAVFSSSNQFLSQTNLNRVPGAVQGGTTGFVTPPTSDFSTPTDIPQDFVIDSQHTGLGNFSSVAVVVPAGANFLFVGPWDTHYGDNTDANHDFAVSVTAAPVPEPTSLALLGVGASALCLRNWRRRG